MRTTTYRAAEATEECGCEPRVENRRLVVDAADCPERGRLAASAACRATAVAALTDRIVSMRTRTDAGEYVHADATIGLLVAAGRFATLVGLHDAALARRARRDPLGAAHEAVGRGGRVGELAAETGLAEGACRVAGYADACGGGRELNPLTSAGSTPTMLHDIDGAGDLAPEELRARYDDRLRAAIHDAGIDPAADDSGVDRETVAALDAGESPELTVEEAAAVLAAREDSPAADVVVAELRDHLLLGMTTAVLDVEAVESGIDGALDAREIQQKIEGRLPMTLDELAMIHGHIEERQP